jgi:arylsulfatase A-like enzyme
MKQSNLLFIFTDEQRFDTLGCYGNARIAMPNLDRLASQSVLFDQAYVTQSVCTPSRSSLMTGLWPHTNGCIHNNVRLPADVPALAEMLPDGYATGYHGKWHLGDEIYAQHGFEDWVSVEDIYFPWYGPQRDPSDRSTYHHFLLEQGYQPDRPEKNQFSRGFAARVPEEHTKPPFLAGTASRFIEDNADQPWCLTVNFLEPHMPFFGPRDDQYDPASLPLPENFDAMLTQDQPLKARAFAQAYIERGHSGLPLRTPEDWRKMTANYWGLCSLVDDAVGRILDALERSGQAENTIIVFTSDHGDMMGSHRLIAKQVQFQEAIRVPMFVRLPGQAPRRVEGPVSHIDLMPTLLDYMGADVPGHLQGQSLRPEIETGCSTRPAFVEWQGPDTGILGDGYGPKQVPKGMEGQVTGEQIATAVEDPIRTIITPDGWKLNLTGSGRDEELYDLNADPGERTNLIDQPDQQGRIDELREQIRHWQAAVDDEVQLARP